MQSPGPLGTSSADSLQPCQQGASKRNRRSRRVQKPRKAYPPVGQDVRGHQLWRGLQAAPGLPGVLSQPAHHCWPREAHLNGRGVQDEDAKPLLVNVNDHRLAAAVLETEAVTKKRKARCCFPCDPCDEGEDGPLALALAWDSVDAPAWPREPTLEPLPSSVTNWQVSQRKREAPGGSADNPIFLCGCCHSWVDLTKD